MCATIMCSNSTKQTMNYATGRLNKTLVSIRDVPTQNNVHDCLKLFR